MKLKIIVAVKDVVFAVVLVVQGHLHSLQALAKNRAGIHPLLVPGIRIAAPVDVGLGQVGIVLPVALVDQGQQAGAVTSRLGAKNAVARLLLGLGVVPFAGSAGERVCQVGQVMGAHEILCHRLLLGNGQLDRFVQKLDEVRKGIAEETADADEDVDARPAQLRRRDRLDANDAAILLLPDRPDAEQGQNLGHIVSPGAHRAGAPDADADRLRKVACFLFEAFDNFACQFPADLPGGR